MTTKTPDRSDCARPGRLERVVRRSRGISFALTTQQIRDRTKTVTRRLGWKNLKPGDRLSAFVKCMGLRRGERREHLADIEVVSVRREPLNMVTESDVYREGFGHITPQGFIQMFCRHMGCDPWTEITRIEFRYV